MELLIRDAKPDELDTGLNLLYEAAMWLKSKNIDYWQVWIDPPESYADWVRQGFDNKEFHFIEDNSHSVIGMYRLQYSDEIFWGKRNDSAGYIHSFTTKRSLKGKGIGRLILRSIERELSEQGICFMRLDCSPHVKRLCEYYESYGFIPKGTAEIQDGVVSLYEKCIVSNTIF